MRAFGCLLGGGGHPRPVFLDTELQEASVPHCRCSSIDVSLFNGLAMLAEEELVPGHTARLDDGHYYAAAAMILQ
jgi:hypothetical protein